MGRVQRVAAVLLVVALLLVVFSPAAVQAQTTPKYRHRGFMLDTARKFFPVSSIYAILDRMYAARMNVFHWHLTDSQSFPLEWSYNGGLLTSLGAFKDAAGNPLIYTRADVQAIVAYAAARGIEVVPEFEMPGHADVWALAFPAIITCNPNIAQPSGQFDLSASGTYTVLAQLFADMLPLFAPGGQRVHVGGDEVAFCWPDANPRGTYQAFYNSFVAGQLQAYGRVPTVWADTVIDAGLQLTKNFTVQTWRYAADASTVSKAGYNTVVSTSSTWYVGNATPSKIRNFKFPASARIIGAELVWFTSPGDDPSDLAWVWPVIDAAGAKMWSG